MKKAIITGALLSAIIAIISGCHGSGTGTASTKNLDWWPTVATPQPAGDYRPDWKGQWWWPTNPGQETSPIWGNRGYIYVLKWTKAEEKEVPQELTKLPEETKPIEGLVLTEKVHFGFDKYTLTPAGEETLKDVADKLKEYPDVKVTVEGHTCSIGTEEYNMGLGMRRATSVRNFLISQGIAPERLKAMSYGETRRIIAPELKRSDYEMNRRVEFDVEVPEETSAK